MGTGYTVKRVGSDAPGCFRPGSFQTVMDAELHLIAGGFRPVDHPAGRVWVNDSGTIMRVVCS